MTNQLAESCVRLFDISSQQVQSSKGKKVLGFIPLMKPHTRLLFGEKMTYNSGAIIRYSNTHLEFFIIEYASEETFCYHGAWKGGEDIVWTSTEIKAGTVEMRLSHEKVVDLEAKLFSYFTPDNVVDSIVEDNPRAGNFIPIYP